MSMFHELMMRKKEEIMYATIKGTLTENDGVFSGFSVSNYLQIQNSVSITQSSNLEFYFKFTTPASFSYAGNYPVLCRLNNGNKVSMLGFYNSSGSIYARGSIAGNNIEDYSYTPQTNTTYYIKLTYANGVETLTLYDVDKNVLLTKSKSITITDVTETLYVGGTSGSHQGTMQSIDLNNSYIKLGSTKYKLQAVVGYTVIGSPTITDGVVSGFSSANYLQTSQSFDVSNANWEFVIRASKSTSGNARLFCINNGSGALHTILSVVTNIFFSCQIGSVTLTINQDFVADTFYYFKIKRNGSILSLSWSVDGVTYQDEQSAEVTNWGNSGYVYYGRVAGLSNAGYGGSIDMNETYIKINNKLWFNGQQA